MKKDMRSIVNQLDKKSSGLAWAETMMYFLLAAISILFIFFAVGFCQAVPVKGFTMPAEISLSTVCIIISCLLNIKIKRYKNEDRLYPYRRIMTLTTATGALFFIFQFLGWFSLVQFISSGSRNLVLILLVAHAVHFIVAFGLCVYFTIKSYFIGSGADLYIWFLNPGREMFFKLTFRYWDFLGYLWVILFVIIQLKVML